jgi:hypothetical protein
MASEWDALALRPPEKGDILTFADGIRHSISKRADVVMAGPTLRCGYNIRILG